MRENWAMKDWNVMVIRPFLEEQRWWRLDRLLSADIPPTFARNSQCVQNLPTAC